MKKLLCILFVSIMLFLTGCTSLVEQENTQTRYLSYKDIPGITSEDISDIEALRAERSSYVFGINLSTEAFFQDDGSLGGFAALLYDRMSELFGVEFNYTICIWDELIEGIDSKELDFTNEFTPTPERLEKYFMTDAIIQRSIKLFTNKNNDTLKAISQERDIRCVFIAGSTIYSLVEASWDMPFEAIFVDDESVIPTMLEHGEVDAYVDESVMEVLFDSSDFIKAEDFYPLSYSPVSLTTGNSMLEPCIKVMQKYLNNGGYYELTELYNQGIKDYSKNKIAMSLTDEEKEYILNHNTEETAIMMANEHDNYPSSFYNKKEKEYQGVAIDVLEQVSSLTGLVFKTGNENDAIWSELLEGLESGKYSVVTELMKTEQRNERFLWTGEPYYSDNYAMISRAEHTDVDINQILFSKIGLIKDTAFADVFISWFPDSVNTVIHSSNVESFAALEKGEIDLLMATQNMLLLLTNYLEKPGFKTNIIFNYKSDSYLGFNKDEGILCSIVDKAQRYIDTEQITEHWKRKVFDYESKMLKDVIPYLIIFVVVLLVTLFGLLILFIKNRKFGKNLKVLVSKRTNELEMQTAKLEVVVKNYSGIIWSIDKDREVTLFDGLLAEKLRYITSLLKEKSMNHEVKNDNINSIAEMIEKTFVEGPQSLISEINGEVFMSRATPVKDKNGDTVGIVGDTVDMTETIRLQKELKATIEIAENASKAKSDFLSRMSHEIRTPLNAIIGMIGIAMSTDDLTKIKHCHERVDNASKHLLGIINDILDMSKIEADKFELSYHEFNFEKMLANIASVVNFRSEEKQQNIIINLDDDIPSYIVSDDLRLSQVITNLLTNAVKFTPEKGTIILSIKKIDKLNDIINMRDTANGIDNENTMDLLIEIADNGIGISNEQKARLFTSFEQADGSISRKFGGTGLGLAISKRIVELMGGNIWIESEIGKGSKFIFNIKVQAGTQNKKARISNRINKDNIRILAVDDSYETRECFLHIMAAHNLPCDVASGGAEALEMIKIPKICRIMYSL